MGNGDEIVKFKGGGLKKKNKSMCGKYKIS